LSGSVARQLGFDTTEVYSARIKIADASRIEVPVVAPIRIDFANRSCTTDAYVLGDAPLIGVVPIEAMDCIIEPRHRRLVVNPAHPDRAELPRTLPAATHNFPFQHPRHSRPPGC